VLAVSFSRLTVLAKKKRRGAWKKMTFFRVAMAMAMAILCNSLRLINRKWHWKCVCGWMAGRLLCKALDVTTMAKIRASKSQAQTK